MEDSRLVCESIIDRVNEVFVGDLTAPEEAAGCGPGQRSRAVRGLPRAGEDAAGKGILEGHRRRNEASAVYSRLLPSDILGVSVWRQNEGRFEMVRGPVFTNVLLADEINRAPPKTQAALLEAMEERQVTIDGQTMSLGTPFLVLATQNPIEQEGTYPLPEAQLDRFLFKLATGYPANGDLENDILLRRIQWQKGRPHRRPGARVDVDGFVELQQFTETGVYVDQAIVDYITRLVRLTREHPSVAVGVSPRGGLALLRVSRSIALIHGRDFVVPDDVKMVVSDALSHRIILNIEDTLEGIRPESVVDDVLGQVPVPTVLRWRP